MHCTWFNEKKSSFPPYIFFVGFFFSSKHIPTSPVALVAPRLPLTTTLGKGAAPTPLPARAARSRSGPAGLQLPTSPGLAPCRPRLPRAHRACGPDCLRGKGRVRPGRGSLPLPSQL